ncbi:hypothetical protein BT96DRAFT_985362 [Gymnopus androsaceus JB14]|uniref:Uncharacterized protein n=1 Tax=Gymnopus androsaceus JB14 TaxID=1447944 RepID=A0A6A4IEL3_9AGAR|nr:hypothetical protein BT96DRAFT_985362 [Gymnopus androsaceus JB14]
MDALISSMTDTFSLILNHGGTKELIPDGDQIEQLPSNEAQALKHAICISYRAISSYTRMQDGLIAVGSAQGTSPIAVVLNDDQRRAELLHHLVDKPPRFIASQALKKSTHARQNYECGAILVQHRHVVNLARVLEEDPKSVESTRHTFFLVVLIIHEIGHYLRSILYPNDSLRRVSPPSLRPHAFLFSPHRSWKNPDLRDENQPRRSPFEGEAGFYLEEIVFGGVVGAVVDRGVSLREDQYSIRKIALYTAGIGSTPGVFELFGLFAVKDEVIKAFLESPSQPMALPFDDQVLETAVDSDDPVQKRKET